MQAEKAVEQYLVRRVKAHGGMCIKLTGVNGVPDRLVIMRNNVAFIELKAPNGRISAIQEVMHKRLKKLGFGVHVLWNFEQVDNFMESMREE